MRKSGSARVALPGIRRTGEAALFAVQQGRLMTQRAGRWSLDNEEKRTRPCSSAGPKTDRRSGALCRTAGPAYDPKSWALESGQQEKRKQPFKSL